MYIYVHVFNLLNYSYLHKKVLLHIKEFEAM